MLDIPQLQWDQQKNIGPVGSCFYDVPQPEGALRRLTRASAPGLVAVLRTVPVGGKTALGEVAFEGAIRQLDPPQGLW